MARTASWQEGVAVAVLLLGLGAGAFLLAQRPSFWLEFGVRLGKAVLPRALKYLTRRMPPEEENSWRGAEKWGQAMLGLSMFRLSESIGFLN